VAGRAARTLGGGDTCSEITAHPRLTQSPKGGRSGKHDTLWIIDPLDGTTNFLHGSRCLPCRSPARSGRPGHAGGLRPDAWGAVHPPAAARAHTWTIAAWREQGRTLEGSLLATGFPYRANTGYLDAYLAMLKAVPLQVAGCAGRSPAPRLALMSRPGRDAFWEIGLAAWDTAAGTLLHPGAGRAIGTLDGAEYRQEGTSSPALPKVYAALVELLGAARPPRAAQPLSVTRAEAKISRRRRSLAFHGSLV